MSMFQREDWTLFRNVPGICQKAGVSPEKLPRLIVKELVDNALDACEECEVGLLEDSGFFVEDRGPGIPGNPEMIAALFSISRPLTSGKLLRLPLRGALGNGLRVVAGAVLASGGSLKVRTSGHWLKLVPKDSGGTEVEILNESQEIQGTRIEVQLGKGIPLGEDLLCWAQDAISMAGTGTSYKGKTSAFWYDSDSFFELCRAAGSRTVRDLMGSFEGLSGNKTGAVAAGFKGRAAASLTREEAESLLMTARDLSKIVKPSRLGAIGRSLSGYSAYAKAKGIFECLSARGHVSARIPYVIEAWAKTGYERDKLAVFINRTPITGTVDVVRQEDKTTLGLFGCGLRHGATVGRKHLSARLNITSPYVPITSDGKEPDFSHLVGDVVEILKKVARGASRAKSKSGEKHYPTLKEVVISNLSTAIDQASGGEKYRYSVRQLFYAIRPIIINTLEKEPNYKTFEKIISEYENAMGQDLPLIYRDDRGTLYHPHEKRAISLGTLSVEAYERPAWTFNKVLYIEKEGFFSILREAQWPERHDCALLTSKGYATRAARDLLDLLGETGEEIHVFCIHDADAYGTLIYQSLQEGTKARPGRRVKVINMGLEPAEALEMGLPYEKLEESKRERPVADYVSKEERAWLQHHRTELNAMITPLFLSWLDKKMKAYGNGKLVPPPNILRSTLSEKTEKLIRSKVIDAVLKKAQIDERVETAFETIRGQLESYNRRIGKQIQVELSLKPEDSWRKPISKIAAELAHKVKENGY